MSKSRSSGWWPFLILLSGLFACQRDAVRPDYFQPELRSPVLDSLLREATPAVADIDDLMLPDGRNMKDFLLTINPDLDSILPRNDHHPFYGLTGNELKSLLITYMTMKAANAYQSTPGRYPGNGDAEPEQEKLGYAAGSHQTDLRTPGEGSASYCPRIFGLDEDGFIRHLLEGAFLTLPQYFQPAIITGYNQALGFSGLAHELEFETFENVDQSFIRTGDIFVLYTSNDQGDYVYHYGLVMADSDDPEQLLMADCFGDVTSQDCKTDVGINVGPRLISLSFLLADMPDATNVDYSIIRLKRKLYPPFSVTPDPEMGFPTVRYGDQLWMADDLRTDNGDILFQFEDLDLSPGSIQGICPEGWHIPSLSEWETLFRTLQSEPYPWPQSIGEVVYYYQGVGQFMKSGSGWNPPGNNLYGFNVIPRGYLDVDGLEVKGTDQVMGYWTSTDVSTDGAASILFENAHHDVLADPEDLKTLGYGCRCVKDVPGQNTNACKFIPVVFHFLKCSQQPTHPVNQIDLSPVYDQIEYLNQLFQFPGYCVQFYLACQNGQPVFEVHDICGVGFTGVDPAQYLHPVTSMQYSSRYIRDQIVSQIQVPGYRWDPDRYINVYIGLTNDGAISAFPTQPASQDAIVMPMEWIAGENVAVDENSDGRALSLAHEIGHYFDLKHPWHGVDHTALVQGPQFCAQMNNGIPDLRKIYGNVYQDTVLDCNSMQPVRNTNIMSYGDFGVATYFSPGQINYMRAVLESPASNQGRSELVRATTVCD